MTDDSIVSGFSIENDDVHLEAMAKLQDATMEYCLAEGLSPLVYVTLASNLIGGILSDICDQSADIREGGTEGVELADDERLMTLEEAVDIATACGQIILRQLMHERHDS